MVTYGPLSSLAPGVLGLPPHIPDPCEAPVFTGDSESIIGALSSYMQDSHGHYPCFIDGKMLGAQGLWLELEFTP